MLARTDTLPAATRFENWDNETLIHDISQVPADIRTAVQSNGGGHANHSLFWSVMGPGGGGEPSGALANAIATRRK